MGALKKSMIMLKYPRGDVMILRDKITLVVTGIFLALVLTLRFANVLPLQDDLRGVASCAIQSYKVNINTATKDDLCSLEGIGEKLSQAIIEYRCEHGAFKTIGDICKVSGIGNKKFENIRNFICVS